MEKCLSFEGLGVNYLRNFLKEKDYRFPPWVKIVKLFALIIHQHVIVVSPFSHFGKNSPRKLLHTLQQRFHHLDQVQKTGRTGNYIIQSYYYYYYALLFSWHHHRLIQQHKQWVIKKSSRNDVIKLTWYNNYNADKKLKQCVAPSDKCNARTAMHTSQVNELKGQGEPWFKFQTLGKKPTVLEEERKVFATLIEEGGEIHPLFRRCIYVVFSWSFNSINTYWSQNGPSPSPKP